VIFFMLQYNCGFYFFQCCMQHSTCCGCFFALPANRPALAPGIFH
jgi:hypothetical protein